MLAASPHLNKAGNGSVVWNPLAKGGAARPGGAPSSGAARQSASQPSRCRLAGQSASILGAADRQLDLAEFGGAHPHSGFSKQNATSITVRRTALNQLSWVMCRPWILRHPIAITRPIGTWRAEGARRAAGRGRMHPTADHGDTRPRRHLRRKSIRRERSAACWRRMRCLRLAASTGDASHSIPAWATLPNQTRAI